MPHNTFIVLLLELSTHSVHSFLLIFLKSVNFDTIQIYDNLRLPDLFFTFSDLSVVRHYIVHRLSLFIFPCFVCCFIIIPMHSPTEYEYVYRMQHCGMITLCARVCVWHMLGDEKSDLTRNVKYVPAHDTVPYVLDSQQLPIVICINTTEVHLIHLIYSTFVHSFAVDSLDLPIILSLSFPLSLSPSLSLRWRIPRNHFWLEWEFRMVDWRNDYRCRCVCPRVCIVHVMRMNKSTNFPSNGQSIEISRRHTTMSFVVHTNYVNCAIPLWLGYEIS